MKNSYLPVGLVRCHPDTVVSLLVSSIVGFALQQRQEGAQYGRPKLHGHNEWDGLRDTITRCRAGGRTCSTSPCFFAFGYLALYPGLAVFQGLLNWSTDSLYKMK